MHPLQPSLADLSNEDLHKQYGDLVSKMTKAYQWGRPDMVSQLQLLQAGYQEEINRRNAKALADMEKNSKQFKNIIDIQ